MVRLDEIEMSFQHADDVSNRKINSNLEKKKNFRKVNQKLPFGMLDQSLVHLLCTLQFLQSFNQRIIAQNRSWQTQRVGCTARQTFDESMLHFFQCNIQRFTFLRIGMQFIVTDCHFLSRCLNLMDENVWNDPRMENIFYLETNHFRDRNFCFSLYRNAIDCKKFIATL